MAYRNGHIHLFTHDYDGIQKWLIYDVHDGDDDVHDDDDDDDVHDDDDNVHDGDDNAHDYMWWWWYVHDDDYVNHDNDCG